MFIAGRARRRFTEEKASTALLKENAEPIEASEVDRPRNGTVNMLFLNGTNVMNMPEHKPENDRTVGEAPSIELSSSTVCNPLWGTNEPEPSVWTRCEVEEMKEGQEATAIETHDVSGTDDMVEWILSTETEMECDDPSEFANEMSCVAAFEAWEADVHRLIDTCELSTSDVEGLEVHFGKFTESRQMAEYLISEMRESAGSSRSTLLASRVAQAMASMRGHFTCIEEKCVSLYMAGRASEELGRAARAIRGAILSMEWEASRLALDSGDVREQVERARRQLRPVAMESEEDKTRKLEKSSSVLKYQEYIQTLKNNLKPIREH